MYSEKDMRDAAAFRAGVHAEALAIVRKTYPGTSSVTDRHPVEAYFGQKWDYPGAWYTVVTIPEGYATRDELVEEIVRDTLARCREINEKHAATAGCLRGAAHCDTIRVKDKEGPT